jgi:predicted O-methyltransferase YrrM
MRDQWTAVDAYLGDLFAPADAALEAAVADSAAAGLPDIQVTPAQGKLLHLLARAVGARRILEIGTLGGYSSIWLGRALPDGGQLVTLEIDPGHAAVARANVARAGLAAAVEVHVGAALATLSRLKDEGAGPFDLVFIDADKPNIPEYFTHAVELSRAGALIVVDNVVREGRVIESESDDPAIRGVRRFNAMAAADPRISVTTLQTVGAKGYDGFALALVLDDPSSASLGGLP